jgi:2'-5' RNA ligase
MPRLFVAAVPGRATIDALRSLTRPDEPGVRWVPEPNWHVTLRFLGEADTDEVTRSLHGIDAASCRGVLGPRVERLGDRQIVVPVAGVDDLAAAVRRATESIGQPDRRPFVGHLTIARTKPGATSALPGAPIAAAFQVDEIVVMASDLRPTGAVYSTVATVKLGPGPRHDRRTRSPRR